MGLIQVQQLQKKLDYTSNRVKSISKRHGFDGWAIINLYPERSLHPNKLSRILDKEAHEQNMEEIKLLLEKYNPESVWVAWGTSIEKRKYLKFCLNDITQLLLKNNVKCLHLGDLTNEGHPKHPRIAMNNDNFYNFDIGNYIKRW